MATRPASDLLENPRVTDVGDMPDATTMPFDRAVEMLSYESGIKLELMTRTSPQIADALPLESPNSSCAQERMFWKTASTVEKAAKIIKAKKRAPKICPPHILRKI